MAATLLAVVIALVLGHLLPALAARVRRFDGYRRALASAQARAGDWAVVALLATPLLLAAAAQWGLRQLPLGWPALLLGIGVLYACWGPRDLDVDVDAVVQAPDVAARRTAAARLWPAGTPVQMEGPALAEAVFDSALRRWFAVLFWFCLLGPVGAVLYRLLAEAATPAADAAAAPWQATLRHGQAVLEWPVVQVMALSLAVVGSLGSVAAAWREPGAFGLRSPLLAHAARASVRSEIDEEVADYTDAGIPAATALIEAFGELPELRDAMRLVWRILLLWLTWLALFVVAGWVG